jgi:hypothetical protein
MPENEKNTPIKAMQRYKKRNIYPNIDRPSSFQTNLRGLAIKENNL